MTFRKISQLTLVAVLLIFVGLSPALADTYPSKPITLIIPLGAGGSHDLNARVFTSVIPQYLGQAMVVKLMPGAGGQTGTAAAIKAKPDGYTLIFTHNYIDQLQPLLEKLPYDTLKDLKSVCRINYGAASVVVRSEKPWKSLDELLAYGKKNPGKQGLHGRTAAFIGNICGLHTSLQQDPGARCHRCTPVSGSGKYQLAGDGDFMMSFPSQAGPLVEAGKIRALASAGDKRVFSDVPTLKELGYETGTMDRIVMAPKGVPDDRMKVLRDAFAKLNSDKTYKRLMKRIGENMEFLDGPEYDKLRPVNQGEYRKLVKKISGQ